MAGQFGVSQKKSLFIFETYRRLYIEDFFS
jgi:hypothetical protein